MDKEIERGRLEEEREKQRWNEIGREETERTREGGRERERLKGSVNKLCMRPPRK